MAEGAVNGTVITEFTNLMHLSPLIAVLLFVILGLCWFIKTLLADARDERLANREALVNNTAVLHELKELIRVVIHR